MNLARLEDGSFLTFITEARAEIRSISINIEDNKMDDLLFGGISAVIFDAIDNGENPIFEAYKIAKNHKNNNEYTLTISEHLENGVWPHYPTVLGLTLNNAELEDRIINYAKLKCPHLSNNNLSQYLLMIVLNAAVKEYGGIGYRFVENVKATNEQSNSIILTMSVK